MATAKELFPDIGMLHLLPDDAAFVDRFCAGLPASGKDDTTWRLPLSDGRVLYIYRTMELCWNVDGKLKSGERFEIRELDLGKAYTTALREQAVRELTKATPPDSQRDSDESYQIGRRIGEAIAKAFSKIHIGKLCKNPAHAPDCECATLKGG